MTCSAAVAEPVRERRDHALEALIEVDREAEAAARLERDEPVQCAAHGARGVDGVVAREAVAAEDREEHLDGGAGGRGQLVVGARCVAA